MTLEEYKKEKTALSVKYENDKRNLAKRYALSNNPFKIGDVISDGRDTIVIESIQIYNSFDGPQCSYNGVWLKKDGTPNKKGEKTSVYQSGAKKL